MIPNNPSKELIERLLFIRDDLKHTSDAEFDYDWIIDKIYERSELPLHKLEFGKIYAAKALSLISNIETLLKDVLDRLRKDTYGNSELFLIGYPLTVEEKKEYNDIILAEINRYRDAIYVLTNLKIPPRKFVQQYQDEKSTKKTTNKRGRKSNPNSFQSNQIDPTILQKVFDIKIKDWKVEEIYNSGKSSSKENFSELILAPDFFKIDPEIKFTFNDGSERFSAFIFTCLEKKGEIKSPFTAKMEPSN
jgi:hypothetical protein